MRVCSHSSVSCARQRQPDECVRDRDKATDGRREGEPGRREAERNTHERDGVCSHSSVSFCFLAGEFTPLTRRFGVKAASRSSVSLSLRRSVPLVKSAKLMVALGPCGSHRSSEDEAILGGWLKESQSASPLPQLTRLAQGAAGTPDSHRPLRSTNALTLKQLSVSSAGHLR